MSILRRLLAPRADSHRALASGTSVDFFSRGGLRSAGGRWVNTVSGLGGPHDRAQSDQYVAGHPVHHQLADDLLSTNGVGRRLVVREPEDCTREGYDITGVEPAVAQAIEKACDGAKGLECLSAICTGRMWARAYGGGAIVMLIDDGRKNDQPIDFGNIRSLRGLLTVDRWELPVAELGRDAREPRTFAKPRLYHLQPAHGGFSSRVHADRVVRIRGMTLPRRLMVDRQWWDGSIYDLAFTELRGYGVSHTQASEALTLLNQGVLQSAPLDDALATTDGPEAVTSRLEAMRAAAGMFGDMVIGGGESYEIQTRPLSGIKDVIDAVVNALVVVSEMPRAVLLGEVPGGLGHGERSPELGIWYDHCKSLQPRIYTPALMQILDVLLRSQDGPTRGQVPKGLEIEWRPLFQETEDQKEDRRVKQSLRRMNDIASRVVSPEEVRTGDRDLQETYGLDPEAMAPAPLMAGEEPEGSLALEPSDAIKPEAPPALVHAAPSDDPVPEDLVDPRVVASRLGVSTRRITMMMARGTLPFWGVMGTRRVSMSEALQTVQRGDGLPFDGRELDQVLRVVRQDPFAGFQDFDACMLAQTEAGESEEGARRICGALQAEAEG